MTKEQAAAKLDEARKVLGEVYMAFHDENVELACFNAKIEIDAGRLSLNAGMPYREAFEEASRVRQTGEAAPA